MPFQELPARLAIVRDEIELARARGGHGQEVRIVAVTKTYGPEAPEAAWKAGIGDVGENRVQEATAKMGAVRVPLRWHLIGHLQRNKLKSAGEFSLIHSMDSRRLSESLDEESQKTGKPFDVLFQVNVSGEGTKGGYRIPDVAGEADRLRELSGVRVCGVMTMAPFDAPESVLRGVFAGAREARDVLRNAGHPATELSMGMSGDYQIAVEEGATLVRLGTVLFGARPS